MSASIIETKFQVLDRATKVLAEARHRGAKVSSQQLRDLVEQERRRAASNNATNDHGHFQSPRPASSRPHNNQEANRTSFGQISGRVSHSATTRREETKDSGHNTVVNTASEGDGSMNDAASRCANQRRRETWQEISATVNCPKVSSAPTTKASKPCAVSRSLQSDRLLSSTEESNSTQHHLRRSVLVSQHNHDSETSASNSAVADPSQFQLDAAESSVSPKSRRQHNTNKVNDVNKVKSGLVRSRVVTRPASGAPNCSPRNWFAATKPVVPIPRSKPRRHRPNTSVGTNDRDSLLNSSTAIKMETRHEPRAGDHITDSAIDRASFYYLELHLDHPEPLEQWRFSAAFTDLSAPGTSPVVLDDIMIDRDNCLLFAAPGRNNATCRYFDPVAHFPNVYRPRDLYDHVLKVVVRSMSPMECVVIDSIVHFTLSPVHDEPQLPPPEHQPSIDIPAALPSDSAADPSRSPVLEPRHRRSRPVHTSAQRRNPLQLTLPSARHVSSTGSLDEGPPGSPWEQSAWSPARKDPMSPPKPRAPVAAFQDAFVGQALATTDRKKLQLRQLRADVRRRMQAALQPELPA